MFKYCGQILRSALLHQNKYYCYKPHLMTTHQSKLTMKATRRSFLNKAVLSQQKEVIYAEKRQPTDLVMKLKQEGKCPGVIIPHNKKKEDEVDIVLSGKAMKTKFQSRKYGTQRVYIRTEGKEYMCVLKEVSMNRKNFIEKVYLDEYVPGQANHLTIPVEFTHLQDNLMYQQKYDFACEVEQVDVICYNH